MRTPSKILGQTVVGLLVGVMLDVACLDRVGRVVAANLLKMGIFSAHRIRGLLGKGGIHHDDVLRVVNLQDILHKSITSFCLLVSSGD